MLTPEVLSEPGMRSMKKQVPDDNIPTREIPWYRYTTVFHDVINRRQLK